MFVCGVVSDFVGVFVKEGIFVGVFFFVSLIVVVGKCLIERDNFWMFCG